MLGKVKVRFASGLGFPAVARNKGREGLSAQLEKHGITLVT